MARYFIRLAYDGTAYHGWQIQENAISVQQVLNENLSTLHQQQVFVTGAGRTDTGVHAREMYAHFDLEQPFKAWPEWMYRINSLLPEDISVLNLYDVNENAHARFDALDRTYKYEISTIKDPFQINRSYLLRQQLQVDKMQNACKWLLHKQDFTSFSKLHSQTQTNICDVTKAEFEEREGMITFTVSADRFLRNMVRCMVGTLIEVGLGKMEPEQVKDILQARDRSMAGFSVPACGLYLTAISYPAGYLNRQLC